MHTPVTRLYHFNWHSICTDACRPPSSSAEEHKSAAVLAINPRGQLPAFQDGDVAVNDSLAAILYLEDTYDSGTRLLPDDATSKAKVSLQSTKMQNGGRQGTNKSEDAHGPKQQPKGIENCRDARS